jgi:hypothetical protein
MDKQQAKDWKWLPAQMPGVVALMQAKRRELGDAHCNLCWTRGVVEQVPGWFFAREGALWVGTPPTEPDLAAFITQRLTSTQAAVYLRNPEGPTHGQA